jgi:hypothetical protein
MQGVAKLLETVQLVGRRMNPGLKVGGIILTMYDAQTKLTSEIVAELEGFIAAAKGKPLPWADARIFRTKVRRNIKLAESPSFGQTILKYEPTSNGAADYRALAREVIEMTGEVAPVLPPTAVVAKPVAPPRNLVASPPPPRPAPVAANARKAPLASTAPKAPPAAARPVPVNRPVVTPKGKVTPLNPAPGAAPTAPAPKPQVTVNKDVDTAKLAAAKAPVAPAAPAPAPSSDAPQPAAVSSSGSSAEPRPATADAEAAA